jgi:PAS domain S-box-containing protein
MKKVLIVDDSIDNLYLLEVLLKGKGFDVIKAANGSEALESAYKTPPDLIISDILMPVMDGFALCRKCKTDEQLRHIPFILYTATYTGPKDERFALSLGADRFVLKPQKPEIWTEILAEIFEEKHTPAQPLGGEMEFFRQYNEILFNKLEKKMLDLEIANQKLKDNEKSMQGNEKFLDSIIENIPDMIFVKDAETLRFVRFNKAGEELLGQKSQDLIGKNDYDVFLKEQADFFTEKNREVLRKKQLIDIPEEHIQTKHLGERILHTKKIPIIERDGKAQYLLGISEDITERKRTKKVLRVNEIRYRELFENIGSGVAVYETPNNGEDFIFKEYNTAAEMIDKTPREKVIGRSVAEVFPGVKDFGLFDVFQRVYRTGKPERHPVTFYKDEKISGWRQNYVYKLPSGEIVAVFEDITEYKREEEALRRSEENFRRSLDESPLGVRIVTAEGETIYANQAILDIYGYDSIEELKTTPVDKRYTPESYAEFRIRREKRLQDIDTPSEYTVSIVRKNGEVRHLHAFRKSILWDGEMQYQVLYDDITELKRAEEQLRYERKRFSVLSENAPFGMTMIDKDGNYIYINPKFKEILGYDLSDIPDGRTWFRKAYPDPEYRHAVISAWVEDFIGTGPGEKRPQVFAVTCKDGTEKIINFIPVQMETGVHVMTCEDITERKQAEEELHKSHREWENIFQAIGHPVFILNPRHDIMTANKAAMLATGMTEQALVGKKCYKILHGKDTVVPPDGCPLEKLLSSGQMETYEMQVELLDAVFLVSCTPVFNSRGQLEKIIHIAMDITSRRQAEDALHTSLQEKDLLINEVHHRVKNNMQVISGLFDLQARLAGNPELTEMLSEGQRRIRAMALIHEKLYETKDFTRVDLVQYVRALSQELFQAYKINPGKIDLIIQTDGAVHVDIDKANPCGLILNELISNVFKHAFPGDKPGKLEIIIHETKDKEIEILVRDNGSGMPDDVDIYQPRSAGLYLLNGLVMHQLEGQIEVIRDAGTAFRVTLPLLSAKNKGVVE